MKEQIQQAERITKHKNQLELWQNKFEHLNIKDLKDMTSKKKVFGIHIGRGDLSPIREICEQWKMTEAPFPK